MGSLLESQGLELQESLRARNDLEEKYELALRRQQELQAEIEELRRGTESLEEQLQKGEQSEASKFSEENLVESEAVSENALQKDPAHLAGKSSSKKPKKKKNKGKSTVEE